MSTSGNDSNAGTKDSPVRTINRAVDVVPAGGTIVVRGGQYRDWLSNDADTAYAIATKGFNLQAYPHEQPWFNGADVVTGWNGAGQGRWSRSWSTPSFCDGKYYNAVPTKAGQSSVGPCTHTDNANDPAYPMAGDPQMVFIDDVQQKQVANLSEVTAGTFHYDWSAKVLTLGTDPNGRSVELAARPIAMVLGNQQKYSVRGLGFTKYATNEYNNVTSGAVYFGANTSTVENSVFTRNAGQGLFLSNPKNGTSVRRSVFASNGFNGLGANGGSQSNTRNDFVLADSIFNGNNAERYGVNCTVSCAAANVKYGHMVGFTVKNNIFENGLGNAVGFWCDLECSDAVIVNNVARNNGYHGIYYEVSDTGIIASNLVVNNGRVGIAVASANTKVYNNTVVTNNVTSPNAQGVWVYDDGRAPGVNGWTDVGPNTTNVELVNNVVSGIGGVLFKAVDGSGSTSTNTVTSQYFSKFDYNAVYHQKGNVYNWKNPSTGSGGSYYNSAPEFHSATGFEGNAIDVSNGVDPFVNSAAGDYRMAPTLPTALLAAGRTLPADVAAALGLPASTPATRGAISWAGSPG